MKEEMKYNMQPFLLKPACKDYLWGGDRLEKEYGKDYGINPLAETWECSVHPDGISLIDSGSLKGMPLSEVIKRYPEMLGTHPVRIGKPGELPVLIKLIDAGQKASVQVHPDDDYAQMYENGENGKAEMWYVLDSDHDAKLVYGFYEDMDEEMVKKALEEQTIEKYLRKVNVYKDDVFYIEPGTVHAIGAGVLLAEIQQNSNLTYRLYDYNRTDQYGKKRDLHVDKALKVANLKKSSEPRQPMRVLKYQPGCATELLCRCKYFQVERILVRSEEDKAAVFHVGEESFCVLLCLDGCGKIEGAEKIELKKGRTAWIPANYGDVKLVGEMQLLKIRC